MPKADNSTLFLCGPEADEIVKKFGDEAELFTFWSLETAYPVDRLRYHLGQLGMLNLMNRLADRGCGVHALICDPQHLTLPIGKSKDAEAGLLVTQQVISTLKNQAVHVGRVSDEIRNLLKYQQEKFRKVRKATSDGAAQFRDFIFNRKPSDAVVARLEQYREYSPALQTDGAIQPFARRLEEEFPGVPLCELLAASYASVRRPKWFEELWIGDFSAWLTLLAQDKKHVVILEANRSAYSWLTHRCFLSIGIRGLDQSTDYPSWPHMCFVRPVKAIGGTRAMELSERAEAIFIDSKREEFEQLLNRSSREARASYCDWFLGGHASFALDKSGWCDAMLARLDEIQEKLKDVLTEKPNESRTVAAHEQSDIALAKSPQAIVSLHGINTRGAWQKEFTSVLSDKGLPHKPYDYGFFHPVRFAFRRSRKAEIRRFIDYYARQGFGPGKAPSVVAHSFGSYIVCIALERNQEIYFKDIILLGSIVRRDFPWSKFTKTGRVRRVLNERAQKDVWVPRAKLVVPDAGPSGVEGFIDLAGGAVQERIHEHFDHSEVLHELRYEHVWVPFLKGETITVSPP